MTIFIIFSTWVIIYRLNNNKNKYQVQPCMHLIPWNICKTGSLLKCENVLRCIFTRSSIFFRAFVGVCIFASSALLWQTQIGTDVVTHVCKAKRSSTNTRMANRVTCIDKAWHLWYFRSHLTTWVLLFGVIIPHGLYVLRQTHGLRLTKPDILLHLLFLQFHITLRKRSSFVFKDVKLSCVRRSWHCYDRREGVGTF